MGFTEQSKNVIGAMRGLGESKSGPTKEIAESSSPGTSSQHVEEGAEPGPRPGVFKRMWLHLKRYWIWYSLAVVVSLAIFLPVFFMVAIPAIAQRMVDDADLPIHEAMIMNPTPDSVEYSLRASIKVPKPFSVLLDPITLHLYKNGGTPEDPYVDIELPEYYLEGNATIEISDQEVAIQNQDVWKSFLKEAVVNEKFILAAKGSTTAHLGALKADITLDKKIEEFGLNNIKGYSIKSARILIPPGDDGALIAGRLNVPNASKVTLTLGNMTLNVMVGGFKLGMARLYDVVLEPGDNAIDARIDADLQTALQNLPEILESQQDQLSRGKIELQASGNTTIFNGERIEYLEYILNDLVLSAELSIMKVLTDTVGGMIGGAGDLISDLMSNVNLTEIMDILGDLDVDIPQLTSLPEIAKKLPGLGEMPEVEDLMRSLKGLIAS